jgi:pilus assembly protein CpaE
MARVLVVDDDADVVKMLGMILERAGHEPILAYSGRQGVEQALGSAPDLAIVDVMMPDISGHEVCRQLRAWRGTAKIPLLILSARAQPVDRDAAMESGATAFLAKPVSPRELIAKVDELLSPVAARKAGRVVTLHSLRGGVGVSTLAANLAASLRAQRVPNVTLVDLSPSCGHLALHLRLRPQRSWAHLLERGTKNEESVRSLLVSHPSRINLLAAPVSPTYNSSLSEAQAVFVAKTLASRAQFVIVDTPSVLSTMCIGALRASDLVILVMSPDISSVQTVMGSLRKAADLGISGRKVHLLLNHPLGESRLTKAAIERALKRPVSFSIPFDPDQSRALSEGRPLSLDGAQSPLAVAVGRIAAALIRAP